MYVEKMSRLVMQISLHYPTPTMSHLQLHSFQYDHTYGASSHLSTAPRLLSPSATHPVRQHASDPLRLFSTSGALSHTSKSLFGLCSWRRRLTMTCFRTRQLASTASTAPTGLSTLHNDICSHPKFHLFPHCQSTVFDGDPPLQTYGDGTAGVYPITCQHHLHFLRHFNLE